MHYDARVRLAPLIGLLFFAPAAPADARDRVELYTIGSGDELFSKFGHAAICMMADELPGGGLCYNYGTSDFSRPIGLGWDVVRGQAKFWVSVSDVLSMIFWFQEQDRTIYRQVLPLTDGQVAGLRAALELDARPENREYIYSHFVDNCSTRPRDLIDEATGGELKKTLIESPLTYRDYAREGFAGAHWALVPAGDLILGRWVDQELSAFEAMFVPRVLRAAVEERFDARPEVVYERQAPVDPGSVSGAFGRFWVVVLVLSFVSFVSRKGAALVVVLVAVLGTLIWAGAVVSPWPELRWNELALILFPADLWLLKRSASTSYAKARLVMLGAVAVLAAAGIFVQPLWPFWVLATAAVGACWWHRREDILPASIRG